MAEVVLSAEELKIQRNAISHFLSCLRSIMDYESIHSPSLLRQRNLLASQQMLSCARNFRRAYREARVVGNDEARAVCTRMQANVFDSAIQLQRKRPRVEDLPPATSLEHVVRLFLSS